MTGFVSVTTDVHVVFPILLDCVVNGQRGQQKGRGQGDIEGGRENAYIQHHGIEVGTPWDLA
jgi:hypothetical protein